MALKNLTKPDLTAVEHAKKRIRKYLRKHKSGLSTGQMKTWTDSVRKGGLIYLPDYQQALYEMRDSHEVSCTNDVWWLRNQPKGEPELLSRESDEPLDNGPLFSGFGLPNEYE